MYHKEAIFTVLYNQETENKTKFVIIIGRMHAAQWH